MAAPSSSNFKVLSNTLMDVTGVTEHADNVKIKNTAATVFMVEGDLNHCRERRRQSLFVPILRHIRQSELVINELTSAPARERDLLV
jgi:hypothetical protein